MFKLNVGHNLKEGEEVSAELTLTFGNSSIKEFFTINKSDLYKYLDLKIDRRRNSIEFQEDIRMYQQDDDLGSSQELNGESGASPVLLDKNAVAKDAEKSASRKRGKSARKQVGDDDEEDDELYEDEDESKQEEDDELDEEGEQEIHPPTKKTKSNTPTNSSKEKDKSTKTKDHDNEEDDEEDGRDKSPQNQSPLVGNLSSSGSSKLSDTDFARKAFVEIKVCFKGKTMMMEHLQASSSKFFRLLKQTNHTEESLNEIGVQERLNEIGVQEQKACLKKGLCLVLAYAVFSSLTKGVQKKQYDTMAEKSQFMVSYDTFQRKAKVGAAFATIPPLMYGDYSYKDWGKGKRLEELQYIVETEQDDWLFDYKEIVPQEQEPLTQSPKSAPIPKTTKHPTTNKPKFNPPIVNKDKMLAATAKKKKQ